MQRSVADKKPLVLLFHVILFLLYIGLSSIYLFLPPLLAILFILFYDALKNGELVTLFFISLSLLIFESEKGYFLFTTIIYFILVSKFVMPSLKQNFSCKSCINFLTVVIIYVGYYLFSLLLSSIFLFPMPTIDYYVVYYILIEFLIVSIL